MFRLSRLIKLAKGKQGVRPAPSSPRMSNGAPVVIWNLTKSCNLNCIHCYASADSGKYEGELSSDEAMVVLDDLNDAGVKMLILSGGEPLLRSDIFIIAKKAKRMGMNISLSSNGTLITPTMLKTIKETGFDYVGVSLDGGREIHDKFRGVKGSFDKSVAGLLALKANGIKTGARFTLTTHNYVDLPEIFDLVEEHGIEKLYLSHLVYSGRGIESKSSDIDIDETRKVMDYIFEKAESFYKKGIRAEIVTGNNDADGAYLTLRMMEKEPQAVNRVLARLEKMGGNSAGMGVANIDTQGFVHPDPLIQEITLGNVKDAPFGDIWNNETNETLRRLREKPRTINGRCGSCSWLKVCGGNNRERAFRYTGDFWGSDPACYLNEEEIRVEVTCSV